MLKSSQYTVALPELKAATVSVPVELACAVTEIGVHPLEAVTVVLPEPAVKVPRPVPVKLPRVCRDGAVLKTACTHTANVSESPCGAR